MRMKGLNHPFLGPFFGLLLINFFLQGAHCDCPTPVRVISGLKGNLTSGPDNYPNDANCAWLIDSTSSDLTISLRLTSVGTECGWDFLHIYDGNNSSAPRIAAFGGTRSNWKYDVVISSSRYLYIILVSDSAVTGSGFEANFVTGPCPSECMSKGQKVCSPSQCTCYLNQSGKQECFKGKENQPSPRAGHSAIYDSEGDQLFVFGGGDVSSYQMDDLHKYDFGKGEWVSIPKGNQTWPAPVSRHASAFAEGKLYIFGGESSRGSLNTFYSFDEESGWKQILADGPAPPSLYGHTLTYVPFLRSLYLFGGYSDSFGHSNKLFVYSIPDNKWMKIKVVGLDPPPTYGHVALYHAGSHTIFFHGGIRNSGAGTYAARDILTFRVISQQWFTLAQANVIRTHHGAVMLENHIIFHGGYLPLYAGNDPEGNSCYFDDFAVYNILCGTWGTIPQLDSNSLSRRSGHSLIHRNGSFYLLGGFSGKFYAGLDQVELGLPSLSDYACLESYCASAADCFSCVPKELCSWCQKEKKCSISPEAVAQNHLSFNLTCSSYQSTCPGNSNCYSDRTCDECTKKGNEDCAWCDYTRSCFPKAASDSFSCNNGWITETCSKDCDTLNTCEECTSKSGSDGLCSWCSNSVSCGLTNSNFCSSTSFADIADCQSPCRTFITSESCHQAHRCMWCSSTNTCLSGNSYITTFPFGQCLTWTLYEEFSMNDTIKRTLNARDYFEYEVDVMNDSTNDMFVLVEASSSVDIVVLSTVSQVTWRGSSPQVIVRGSDHYRRGGLHRIRIENDNSVQVSFQVKIEMRLPSDGGGIIVGGYTAFNVVYFVSFFFLFLFSFLFVAIIVRKVREIVRYNHLRNEYIKARALRVIPPKFSANILDQNGELNLLTASLKSAVPIAVEYYDGGANQLLASVTFACVLPPNSKEIQDDKNYSHRLCFATTVSVAGKSLPPPIPIPPPRRDTLASVTSLETPDGMIMPRFSEGYTRLVNSQSITEDSMEQLRIEEEHGLDVTDISNFPDELIQRLDAQYLRGEN